MIQMLSKTGRPLWAVLLAGDDVVRLQKLTKGIAEDSRPKQFCPVFGGRSLFEHTRARIYPLFSRECQVSILSRAHERYFSQDLAEACRSALVQPLNRGTGIGVALALVHISLRDPEAIVGFMPCDHHYADDDSFRLTVRSAVACAERYPESIVMVGAPAEYPETDCGKVSAARGGQPPGVFELIARCVCDDNAERTFDLLPHIDFSRDVLTREPQRLMVLNDRDSGWADLGTPARVFQTLARNGLQPEWSVEQPLSSANNAVPAGL